jgi:hypothetical protein
VKLIWHIARKDLRRMALPVSVWLALILVPTIAVRVAAPGIAGHAGSTIDMWNAAFSIWARLLEGVQLVIGCLLVGSLVLEDPLVGTTSFWSTRPIGSMRLLAAKIVAALVLFFVAPIVVLTPVWIASSFGFVDLVQAGWDFATRVGGSFLIALMLASASRNLAQFLFGSILVGGIFAATTVIPASFWQDAPMMVRASREWLIMIGMLPAVAAILVHQYLTRRVVRTWFFVGGALLAIAVIRCAWPWDIRAVMTDRPSLKPYLPPQRPLLPPRAEDRAAEITAPPAFTKSEALHAPYFSGQTMWHADGVAVPMYARTPEGLSVMRAGEMWCGGASLNALGFNRGEAPLRWELGARDLHYLREFTGTYEVWYFRPPRVLGELPVRVGAELRVGPRRTRILGLVFNEGRMDKIYIEERDTRAHLAAAWVNDWGAPETGRERFVDCYVLVDGARRFAMPAQMTDLGRAPQEMNSLAIRFRELGMAWRNDEHGEPTLVKLRFERDHVFDLPAEQKNPDRSNSSRAVPRPRPIVP